MASLSSFILLTIILCIRLNNLPVVDAINVTPVWNAPARNESWPCLLSYDDVESPDVVSVHGDPGQICSVQVISSPKIAALIQLPPGTHPDTFLYAERQGDLHGCQNRYVAITAVGSCTSVFQHPYIHLFLEGNITTLLSKIPQNSSMCYDGEGKDGGNGMGENQTKQCSTQEFVDTISCTLDQNQICSFHFPSACSSIIDDRSVEFHCDHTHSNQRFLVIFPTDSVALQFVWQNILEINGNPFSGLSGLKKLILEYNQLSFLHSSAFSGLDALIYLSLRGNKLVTLDIAVFQSLKELVYLDLGDNKLRSFHSDTFKNLVKLNELILDQNELVDIPNSAFSDLQNLKELYLFDNELFSLERDVFNETSNLLLLNLGNNRLKHLPKTLFSQLPNLLTLILARNLWLSFNRTLFQGLSNLKALHLREIGIKKIDARLFLDLNNLEVIDLGNNRVTELDKRLFKGLLSLKMLYLHRNQIKALDLYLFCDNVNLRLLHLAENKLTDIPNFNNLRYLNYFNLQDNSLIMIDRNTFVNFSKLTEIVVSQPEICECYVSAEINCSALNVRSPYLTCNRLLSDRTLVVIMWVIGLNALCGNMFVLMWRKKKKDGNKVQTFLLSNLAMSDFLMGIYMLLIGSADIYFGEYFPMQAEVWRNGTTCRVAGTISIVSSEASVFFITLISIDRFINIRFPFSHRKLASKSTHAIVAILWLTALTLGLIPSILAGKSYKFYDNSHVCIGLPLAKLHLYSNTASEELIEYKELNIFYFRIRVQSISLGEVDGLFFSSGLFLGLNCICYLVILLCYMEIVRTVLKSSKRVGLSPEVKKQVKMTAKVAAIVLTDFLCWSPVILLGVLVQAGVLTLPPSVFAWCVTVVLPINSAINPYLYTISHIIGSYREKSRSLDTSNPRETSQSQNQAQTIQDSSL